MIVELNPLPDATKPSRSLPSPSSALKRPSALGPSQTTADAVTCRQRPAAVSGAAESDSSARIPPPTAESLTVTSLRSPGSPTSDRSKTETSGPLTPPSTCEEPVTVAAPAGVANSASSASAAEIVAIRIRRDVTRYSGMVGPGLALTDRVREDAPDARGDSCGRLLLAGALTCAAGAARGRRARGAHVGLALALATAGAGELAGEPEWTAVVACALGTGAVALLVLAAARARSTGCRGSTR